MNTLVQPSIIGESPIFQSMLRALGVAAATNVTVMLLGESGTGKELLARHLHLKSRRANAPFVAINCAALPENLAESELFGHRKGSFTGAVDQNEGRIRSAEGGTLFLDEIAEMPLSVQAKLLRFLESGEFQAVGDTKLQKADIRLVAATHADLYKRVQAGQFRADLYYRLNVVPFQVPALRDRSEDILLLFRELTQQLANQHGMRQPRYLPECLQALAQYAWPGNIRELRNVAERMLILFSGQEVGRDNLPQEILASVETKRSYFSLPDSGLFLEDLEQDLLRQALDKTHGNQSKAARLLGLTRDTFLYRLKKYAIL